MAQLASSRRWKSGTVSYMGMIGMSCHMTLEPYLVGIKIIFTQKYQRRTQPHYQALRDPCATANALSGPYPEGARAVDIVIVVEIAVL